MLKLTHVGDVRQFAHLTSNGGDLVVCAHDSAGGTDDASPAYLLSQGGTVFVIVGIVFRGGCLVDDAVAFVIREEIVYDEEEGVFVYELQSWVLSIDFLKVWV